MCASSTSAPAATLPWYWQGWAAQLSALPHVCLTQQTLATLKDTPLTPSLRIFVDFWPDELSDAQWETLQPFLGQIFFLPPLVHLPAQVSSARSKPCFIFGGDATVLPSVHRVDNQNGEELNLQLPPLSAKYFTSHFPQASGLNAPTLAALPSADSWIVSNVSAPDAHALYQLAQDHHIPLAFWDSPYSSPLRQLCGYRPDTRASYDASLRQRFARVRAATAPTATLTRYTQLAQVLSQLGYARWFAPAATITWALAEYQNFQHTTLPQEFQQAAQNKRAVIAQSCATEIILPDAQASSEEKTLAWKKILIGILSLRPEEALKFYGQALSLQPAETLYASQWAAHQCRKNPSGLINILNVILRSIFVQRFQHPLLPEFFTQLYQLEKYWLPTQTDDQPPSGAWTLVHLMNLMGAQPSRALPASATAAQRPLYDLHLFQSWALLHAGQADAALTAAQKDLQDSKASAGAAVALLGEFFRLAPAQLPALMAKMQGLLSPAVIANAATRNNWNWCVNTSWRNERRALLQQFTQDMGRETEIAFRVPHIAAALFAGDTAQALDVCKKQNATWTQQWGMTVAHFFWMAGQQQTASELLDSADPAAMHEWNLARYATLAFGLGNAVRGSAALAQMQKTSPYFWSTHLLSSHQEEKIMLAGLIAAAIGDHALRDHALKKLSQPSCADRHQRVAQAPTVCTLTDIPAELRQWIASTL